MANPMKSVLNVASEAVALEVALEGARRATGSATSSAAPADPEVVTIARRRQFSPADKRRIVAAADRCTEPGEIGALLRREGIYSSQLATWRKNRATADGRMVRQRGRKADPAVAEAQRTAKITRENERLRRQLTQARLIIDVQKKVSCLIALHMANGTEGESAWTP